MQTLTLLLIALGLAVDAFAVAIATSILLVRVSPRQVFRLAFHFGLFQALMPVLGWWGGRSLGTLLTCCDHWVAFGVLALIGGRACYDALRTEVQASVRSDPTRGASLILLALATSVDALAVGVSLAFLRVGIWYPSALIGIVAAALTAAGMLCGARLGAQFGRRVALVGGLLLIGIGVKVLVQDLV